MGTEPARPRPRPRSSDATRCRARGGRSTTWPGNSSIGERPAASLLDIVVSPDRSEWRWEDEDEVLKAVELGLMSPERAGELRAEGERALEKLLAHKPPFERDWDAWRPDEAWPTPKLPNGWEFDMGFALSNINLTSPAFGPGQPIPAKYTGHWPCSSGAQGPIPIAPE